MWDTQTHRQTDRQTERQVLTGCLQLAQLREQNQALTSEMYQWLSYTVTVQ